MKPKTWKAIKERLEENLRNMNGDIEDDQYTEMSMENETMEWICLSEGKKKDFKNYQQGIAINIQCEEDGIE